MVAKNPGPTIIFEHQSHFSYNKITLREDIARGAQTYGGGADKGIYYVLTAATPDWND